MSIDVIKRAGSTDPLAIIKALGETKNLLSQLWAPLPSMKPAMPKCQ